MATFTLETNSRIAMAKTTLNKKKKKKTPFSSKMGLNWRKKPVKCYIWRIALCGAETWTLLGKMIRILWNFLKCGAGEGWRRSFGPIAREMKKYYIVVSFLLGKSPASVY